MRKPSPVCAIAFFALLFLFPARLSGKTFAQLVAERGWTGTETELDCSDEGLTDLDGIEKFVDLTRLDVSHNDITCADLSGNKKLAYLDLSHNAKTQGFYYGRNPSPANPYIKLANSAPLAFLSMEGCTGLKRYESLFSANGFHANKLKTLILKGTGLNFSFKAINPLVNSITYLDLSGCKVSYIENVSQFQNLETLILSGVTTPDKQLECVDVSKLKNLRHLDVSGNDIYLRAGGGSKSKYLLDYLKPKNNPDLETFICSGSKLGKNTTGLDGFTSLKAVDVSGNPAMTGFYVKGATALQSIAAGGDTGLKSLTLTGNGMTDGAVFTGMADCTALETVDLSGNAFTAVPKLGNTAYTTLCLNDNRLTRIENTGDANVQYLYAQNNSFTPKDYTLASDLPYTGIDLGNNGFTGFTLQDNANLKSLMLGGNTALTALHLHRNAGLTHTTASAAMAGDGGVYLLGCTALATLDLASDAESYGKGIGFTGIGAGGSLAGLTAVTTLNGQYNQFTTFSNKTAFAASSYTDRQSTAKTKPTVTVPGVGAHADLPNLCDLTGLQHLDLSYNRLEDSVHLYSNRELTYLDVSHNQKIVANPDKGKNGSSFYTTAQLSSLLQNTNTATRDANRKYKKYLWIAATRSNVEPYTGDQNDTTGLTNLDLRYNTKLRYLDISYTGITQTALYHYFTWNPRYIWLQNCTELETYKANGNGMRSNGVGSNRQLRHLEVQGMRGADDDIMLGRFTANASGNNPLLDYIDVSDSQFDSINVRNAPNLVTLKVAGNPIKYLYLNSNPKLQSVDATRCTDAGYPATVFGYAQTDADYDKEGSEHGIGGAVNKGSRHLEGFRQLNAQGLPELKQLDVTGSAGLVNLYANRDAVLPAIAGLSGCRNLQLLYVDNDPKLATGYGHYTAGLDNLLYLHAYNDPGLGNQLRLSDNPRLLTAWISNDGHSAEISFEANTALDTLKIYDNNSYPALNLGKCAALRYLDFHACNVGSIDLSANTALTHFNSDSKGAATATGCLRSTAPGNNYITELDFNSAALQKVHASLNNLYRIGFGGKQAALDSLDISHNHINGLDLRGTRLSAATLNDADNGREVRAESAAFSSGAYDAATGTWQYTNMYYNLRLTPAAYGDMHVALLKEKTTWDVLADNAVRPSLLGEDGFDLQRVGAWTGGTVVRGTRSSKAPARVTRDVTSSALDPAKISGDILVLEDLANYGGTTPEEGFDKTGRVTYTYDTGVAGHTSTYYLDWHASSSTVTGLDQVIAASTAVTGGQGSIQVTAASPMRLTVADLAGRVLIDQTVEAGPHTLTGLAPGIYLVNGTKVIVK